MTRQQRRYMTRKSTKAEHRQPMKRNLMRPDPMAQHYGFARAVLMSGPRATPPTFSAIRKTARFLLAMPGQLMVPKHLWGSWRSWPRKLGGTNAETV